MRSKKNTNFTNVVSFHIYRRLKSHSFEKSNCAQEEQQEKKEVQGCESLLHRDSDFRASEFEQKVHQVAVKEEIF